MTSSVEDVHVRSLIVHWPRLHARDRKRDLRYFKWFWQCECGFRLNRGRRSRIRGPFSAETPYLPVFENYPCKTERFGWNRQQRRFFEPNILKWVNSTQKFDQFEFSTVSWALNIFWINRIMYECIPNGSLALLFRYVWHTDPEKKLRFAQRYDLLRNTYNNFGKEELKQKINLGFVISDFEFVENRAHII